MPRLASARRQYEQQRRITALGLRQAQRNAGRGSKAVARTVRLYQAAAVSASLQAIPSLLSEQGIPDNPDATVVAGTLLTDTSSVASMVDKTEQAYAFDRLVQTLIQDAGRTATTVGGFTRPAVTGYVRYLTAPSCSRCAILAGRMYRYSTGFQRHPGCDCVMQPSTHAIGAHLVSDPMQAFRNGEVRGLSKADTEAVGMGANLGQVVNVRRRQAGLITSNSVIERAGRLTPAGCLSLASGREQAMSLLRKYGYVT